MFENTDTSEWDQQREGDKFKKEVQQKTGHFVTQSPIADECAENGDGHENEVERCGTDEKSYLGRNDVLVYAGACLWD